MMALTPDMSTEVHENAYMPIRGDWGDGKCNYMLSVRIQFKRNDISNLEVKGCKH